jgi:hypothetical protein
MTQWTDDEVSGTVWSDDEDEGLSVSAIAAHIANVSNPHGVTAAQTSFVQSGTGAVATTVADRLKRDVQVLDFIPLAQHASILARNNANDLTSYIQAAIDEATAKDAELIFPGGILRFTQLTVNENGFIWRGQGMYRTTLLCTEDDDGILVVDTDGSTETRNPKIMDMAIDGPGTTSSTTSTGAGIHFGEKSGSYNGSHLHLENVSVRYFDEGVFLQRVDQVKLVGCRLEYNNTNLNVAGTCNTLNLMGTSTGNGFTRGMNIATGAGIVITGGDHVTQESLRITGAGTQVSMIGGNFENGEDEGCIVVGTNATFVGIGQNFLKQGGGSEMSPVRVESNGRCVLIAPFKGGYTSPLVLKEASAIVNVIAPTNTAFSGGDEISENSLTTIRGSALPTRVGATPPAASVNLRGELMWIAQQNGSSLEDRLVAYIRDRTGSAYEFIDLTDPRRKLSLTGASHARVQGAWTYQGQKNLTTDADGATSVTITIDTFSTLYSAIATIEDSSGRNFLAVCTGNSAGSGTVTFSVRHPDDTAGSISVDLMYTITVSR